MTTYYLSGPMRGKPDYNYPQFMEVEAALGRGLSIGCTILNPAKNFDGDTSRPVSEYMNADLKMVLDADVLVLLPGWSGSEGATREVELASWAGKKFMTADRLPDDWEFSEVDLPSLGTSPRQSALDEARALITGDRNNSYGPPTQDFQRSADALNAYGYRGPEGRLLQAHDVAVLIMSVKLSRLMWTPAKRDHWVDIAGYAGCGYECAITENS